MMRLFVFLSFLFPFASLAAEKVYISPLMERPLNRTQAKRQEKFLKQTHKKLSKLIKKNNLDWEIVKSSHEADLVLRYWDHPLAQCRTYSRKALLSNRTITEQICSLGMADIRNAKNVVIWKTEPDSCTMGSIFGTLESSPTSCVMGMVNSMLDSGIASSRLE